MSEPGPLEDATFEELAAELGRRFPTVVLLAARMLDSRTQEKKTFFQGGAPFVLGLLHYYSVVVAKGIPEVVAFAQSPGNFDDHSPQTPDEETSP